MPKKAQARIKINKLLEEAGWRFLTMIASVWPICSNYTKSWMGSCLLRRRMVRGGRG